MNAPTRPYGMTELTHDVNVTLNGKSRRGDNTFYRTTALAKIATFVETLDEPERKTLGQDIRELEQYVRGRTK